VTAITALRYASSMMPTSEIGAPPAEPREMIMLILALAASKIALGFVTCPGDRPTPHICAALFSVGCGARSLCLGGATSRLGAASWEEFQAGT
jgi:hypothetical protein